MTRTFRRIDTSASIGTGLARTRCCQPAASRRLARTAKKPVSESSTARRTGCWAVAAPIAQRRIVLQSDVVTGPPPLVTPWSQVRRRLAATAAFLVCRPGGVGELAEQPGDDEGHLLADVDRVVPDP